MSDDGTKQTPVKEIYAGIMSWSVSEEIIKNRHGVDDPPFWIYEQCILGLTDAGYEIVKIDRKDK